MIISFVFLLFFDIIASVTSYGSRPGSCTQPNHYGATVAGNHLSRASYKVCIDDCASKELLSSGSQNVLHISTSYTLTIKASGSAKIRGFLIKLSGDDVVGSFRLVNNQDEFAQFPPFGSIFVDCPDNIDALGHAKDLGNGESSINAELEVDTVQDASLEVIVVEGNSDVNRWYRSTYTLLFQEPVPTNEPQTTNSESPSSFTSTPTPTPTIYPTIKPTSNPSQNNNNNNDTFPCRQTKLLQILKSLL